MARCPFSVGHTLCFMLRTGLCRRITTFLHIRDWLSSRYLALLCTIENQTTDSTTEHLRRSSHSDPFPIPSAQVITFQPIPSAQVITFRPIPSAQVIIFHPIPSAQVITFRPIPSTYVWHYICGGISCNSHISTNISVVAGMPRNTWAFHEISDSCLRHILHEEG